MVNEQDIQKMNFQNGEPFCRITVGSDDPQKLGYLNGSPWWAVAPSGGSTTIRTGNIKRVAKVNWGEIKTVSEVEGW